MPTRKDFVATARILRETKASKKTIDKFVSRFKRTNPRFDEERFRKAIKKK